MLTEHSDTDIEAQNLFEEELEDAISTVMELGGCVALTDFESFDALEDNRDVMLAIVCRRCEVDVASARPVRETWLNDGNVKLQVFKTSYPGLYVGRYEFVCNDGYLVWTIQDLNSEY